MNCKLFFFSMLVFPALSALSQTEDATNVAKITLINPGLSYEARIAKYQTIYAQVFMNTSAYGESSGFGQADYSFYFDPAATLQYRYYYNGARRLENEKRTDMNSMNYIALIGETFFSKIPLTSSSYEETKRRAVNKIGAAWGLQRNFEKHFSVDINLGLGYLFSKGTEYDGSLKQMDISQITFLGQLNIGFWFGGKN